ncbi:tetracycline resistance protein [Gordoniibacillus kamchatkensis]|uniref:Tetracycline resistance protein n=1 Tax=Gordoniibacillus kamchatkensis TaxID=1590651 RepID=A0ABR5AFK7_9BACL|nr:tetracycline resistance MFS efflux pump [Paenibacillus sp. VKM B-2647]KIL39162.1 tetracycline resistance protein [Paenibacillus sp. VKM B-2647]
MQSNSASAAPLEGAFSETQTVSFDLKKTVPWILFVIFFGVLNETVFNVSTPKIAEQYALQPSGVSWVVTSFILTFGIGSVIYGKLSDMISLKKLITIGMLIYNVASLLGFALQASYPLVIAARALQGAGAAAIPALIMVIIVRYFRVEDRGKVFGMLNSTAAFSVGVGPVIGGFISSRLHWSLLFLLPLFTLIAIAFFRRVLPDEAPKPGKVDIPGAVLLALGLGLLILYLTDTRPYYLIVSLALLLWFGLHIRRAEEPFIDPSLFAKRKFIRGVLAGFILFCTVMGIMFVIPLMLNGVHGLSTGAIGWILFPGAISAVVFGTVGGTLADRRGNPFVVYVGLGLLTASLVLMSALAGQTPWLTSGALLLTYVGFSFIQTALANSVSQTLAPEETGVGMGLFNLVGFLSGAVGTALVGKVLDKRLLDFSLLPTVTLPSAFLYSNLPLVFAVVILLGGAVYTSAYRRG